MPTMTFAEVQIIAEQIGTAGRSLSITSRYYPRLITAGSVPVRPKTSVAEMDESVGSSPHELQVASVHSSPSVLVSATDYAAHSEQGSELSAVGSDTSFPTRGYASAAGSVHDEAVLEMDERTRSFYLCLRPGHFLMEFPFLGSDVNHAAQRQREALFRELPATTPTSARPHSSARFFNRPPGIPPPGGFRPPAVAFHPIKPVSAPPAIAETFVPAPPAENETGSA
jgi:hypothetical protein